MIKRISFLVLVLLIPLLVKDAYYLHIIIMMATFAIGALGVRLVMLTGQVTMAQAAFMLLGMYTSVLLRAYLDLSFWLSFPLVGLAAGMVALLLGYPSLRLKGIYFTIVMMMLVLLVRQVIIVLPVEIMGGEGGFGGGISPPDAIHIFGYSLEFTGKVPFYYLILALFLITMWVGYRLDKSRLGGILRAIQQSGSLAESMGINTLRYKLLAFVIASSFASMAGSFYAHYYLLAHPKVFTLWHSFYMVVYAIAGGMGSVIGPIVGTVVIIGAFELFRELEEFQMVSYAAILIVVIYFLPGGLISLGPLVRAPVARFTQVFKKAKIEVDKSAEFQNRRGGRSHGDT